METGTHEFAELQICLNDLSVEPALPSAFLSDGEPIQAL